MAEAGVGTMVYYSVPSTASGYRTTMPIARREKAAREVLSLPMGPMLSNHAIGRVVDVLREAVRSAPGEVVAA